MNKKTISFHIYQANRLEQWAENRCVAEIIIIDSSCSSTEESDYKPLSYDSKGNYQELMYINIPSSQELYQNGID